MRILANDPTLTALAEEARIARQLRVMDEARREDHERTDRARRMARVATVAETREHARRIAEKLRSRTRRHERKLANIRRDGIAFASGFVARPIAS